MTITEQFKAKRCVFSIECFPPKQTTQMDKLKDTLRQMQAMDPGFISVTFGAGGSAGGVSTAEVADYIQNELHIPTLAHLICMGNDETRAAEILDQLESVGVRDVLALRGDRSPSRPESPDFKHASDLTSFIKWKKPEFSVHGACYPEGHPEADSLLHDVENLRIKQAAGAEHLLGRGDMLFKPSGGRLQRLHGPFLSDEEVQNVVGYWKHHLVPSYKVSFADWNADGAAGGSGGGSGAGDVASDPLYAEVQAFVTEQGRVSISLIQRRFKIGFNRAANMVEQLEADGIIGPADGSKPRAVVK